MAETQLASLRIGSVDSGEERRKSKTPAIVHIFQDNQMVGWLTKEDVLDDLHVKSLENTLETYDIQVHGHNKYAEYLSDRNRITIPDEDGNLIEFIIVETKKVKGRTHTVRVLAKASYLQDIKKAKVIRPTTLNEYTVSMLTGWALDESDWQVGIIESDNYRTMTIENPTNPYEFLKRIANEFNLELRFRVEHDGNKITGRFVDLLERVGSWQGREVEFGHDLNSIERSEKTENIVTCLVGYGPEDEDGNRLEVVVKDEEAIQRWGELWDYYEPTSSRLDMTESELRQYTRTELNKRINKVVTYKADIIDLENVPGMENKKIRFGDTIHIKDLKFNPALYLEARVFEQRRSLFKRARKQVKLGDFTEFTEEEVDAIWNQLRQQINQKISARELYEYTYDKIAIDNKDDSVRTEVESYADTVSSAARDDANTYTNNTVEPIEIAVGDLETEQGNISERLTSAETEISQTRDEINLKADSAIVDGIEGRVTTAEQNINGLEGAIVSKVEETTFNILEGRVDEAESTISQHATQIQSKIDDGEARSIFTQEASSFTFEADQINFDGHVFGTNATFAGELQAVTGTFGDVTVNDGDFNLKDEISDVQYSIVSKNNLIQDHSFELVQKNDDAMDNWNPTHDWFSMIMPSDYMPHWRMHGRPRVSAGILSALDDDASIIFGDQHVIVSDINYVETTLNLVPGKNYTLSAHFKRHYNTTAGARPRFEVYRIDALGNLGSLISSETFHAVQNDYNVERHSLTFTTPVDLEEDEAIAIQIKSSTNYWVAVDGVQVVPGNKPTIYDPEENFWRYISGENFIPYLDVKSLNIRDALKPNVHEYLSLINGWQNYGAEYTDAAFTKTNDGYVHLRGMVKSGSIGSSISQLPIGCRPLKREIFSTISSGNVATRVDVHPNGEIIPYNGSSNWINLSGIAFRAER